MGFLAPLYILGGLAVALPIIFHLIRRQPRGRQIFSTLMFLSPSPPRLVKRNRLDNILLLIIRGLVLTLLALAFMRPFWRSAVDKDAEEPARRRIVLVDTSASMQRESLWQQAQQKINEALSDIGPRDTVALYAFDARLYPLVSIDDAIQAGPAQRPQLLKAAVEKLKPSWYETDLGLALMTCADLLHSASEEKADGSLQAETAARGEIILITDLQTGSRIHKLEGYQWPDDIRVDVRTVRADNPSNARAVILSGENDTSTDGDTNVNQMHIRIANSKTSKTDQLSLTWRDAAGKMVGDQPLAVQIPPGEVRVVKFSAVPIEATQVVLEGDAQAFDNAVHFVQREKLHRKLIFVGKQSEQGQDALSYFLARLPLENPQRDVKLEFREPGDTAPWADPAIAPLTIFAKDATVADADAVAGYIKDGGHVLWVLERPIELTDDATPSETLGLRRLSGDTELEISEAPVREYAMIQQVSFQHPLFTSLDNPRFNDFTKIKFWKHRKIAFGDENQWRVLAQFDDHSPALAERGLGRGRVWVLAAGWQPTESQFALSSKFVTLIGGMFELAEPSNPWSASMYVGEKVNLDSQASGGEGPIHLTDARGLQLLPQGDTQEVEIREPGLYTINVGDRAIRMAANLAVDESLTEPMDLARLEQLGVAVGKATTLKEWKANKRQMQAVELEHRQQAWRWIIILTLVLIAVESLVAARATRRAGAAAMVGTV